MSHDAAEQDFNIRKKKKYYVLLLSNKYSEWKAA